MTANGLHTTYAEYVCHHRMVLGALAHLRLLIVNLVGSLLSAAFGMLAYSFQFHRRLTSSLVCRQRPYVSVSGSSRNAAIASPSVTSAP